MTKRELEVALAKAKAEREDFSRRVDYLQLQLETAKIESDDLRNRLSAVQSGNDQESSAKIFNAQRESEVLKGRIEAYEKREDVFQVKIRILKEIILEAIDKR